MKLQHVTRINTKTISSSSCRVIHSSIQPGVERWISQCVCCVQSHLRGKRERSCVHWCLHFLYCWERRTSRVWTSRHYWNTDGFYSLRRREAWQKLWHVVCGSTSSQFATRQKCKTKFKSWDFGSVFTFPADEGAFAQSTLRILHQVVF